MQKPEKEILSALLRPDGQYKSTVEIERTIESILRNCKEEEEKKEILYFLLDHFTKYYDSRLWIEAYRKHDQREQAGIAPQKHQAESIINFLRSELGKIKQDRTKKDQLTYQWQTNPDQELPKLYRKMIDGRFIDDKTDFNDFKAVFTGQPIQSITNKIKWLAEPVLFAYFIDMLMANNKLPIATDYWLVAKNCFEVNANVTGLKHLKQSYLKNKECKPKHHKLIDDLIDL